MRRRGSSRPVVWAALILAGLPGCATGPWDRRVAVPEPSKATAAPEATPEGGRAAQPAPQISRDAKAQVIPTSAQEPADGPAVSSLPPPRPLFPPVEGGPLPSANPLAAPTAAGGLLNLAPHETAIERAVELAQRLGVVEAEKQALSIRVRQLEATLDARDRMLAESAREVEQATAEMTATRNDLRALRKELAAVSGQVRQSEKADLDSMKAILASLEKLLDPNPDKVPGP